LISFLIILINNIFYLEDEKNYVPLKETPYLSSIVPARNEEQNIGDCLKGVLRQHYENLEVVVVDDESKDKTVDIVEKYVKSERKVKLIRVDSLPEGWMGKNYACYKGFKISKGEYLIFTDADTRFINTRTVEYAVSKMKEKGLQLLSLLPLIETKSFWERIFMPMWSFAFVSFFPLKLLSSKKYKKVAFAIGPFMMFERKFYERIGGHESVKGEIVDDVYLARETKEKGGKIALLDGKDFIKVRFYKNYKEMKRGTVKSAFGAFSYSYRNLFLFLTLFFIIFALPFINLVRGILIPSPSLLKISFLEISLIYLLKFISDSYNSHDLKYTLLFPLSLLTGVYFCLLSAKEAFFKKGYAWKERFYQIPGK
jgi:chlorobactene glucosyltransferase